MRTLFVITASLFLFSCATLKTAPNRNDKNTNDIGIDWIYSGAVHEKYKMRLDSAFLQTMEKFNQQPHTFMVHKKGRKDKDYIILDFTKGRVVSKGGRAAGYAVSALGLVALPVLLVQAEVGVVAAFYYFPQNQLEATAQLSPGLAADRGDHQKYMLRTGALFAKSDKQVDKMIVKMNKEFEKMLLKIDKQISSH